MKCYIVYPRFFEDEKEPHIYEVGYMDSIHISSSSWHGEYGFYTREYAEKACDYLNLQEIKRERSK